MDGITLFAIAGELRKRLPLKVRRIYQPSAWEIHILLWGRCDEVRIGISADPSFPFFGVIDCHPQYPASPPSFCQLLRSRLEGQSLYSIEQRNTDRYLSLIFVPHPGADPSCARTVLLCDLRGTRSDILLVEPGAAPYALKRKPAPGQSSAGMLPGPAHEVSAAAWAEKDGSPSEEKMEEALRDSVEPWKTLVKFLPGAGKDLSISILARAGLADPRSIRPDEAHRIVEIVAETERQIREKRWEPCVYRDPGGMPVLHVLPLVHLRTVVRCNSPEEASTRYYALAKTYREVQSLKRQQSAMVSVLKKKLSSRLEAQERDSLEASSYEELRVRGELLYASGKRLPPGSRSVRVLNYYRDPPSEVEIPLDPSKSLEGNARSYLERYKKLKRKFEFVRRSVKQTREALETVRQLEDVLAAASSKEELSALGEEIEAVARWYDIRVKQQTSQGSCPVKEPAPRIASFSLGGYRLFVGGTSRQNDYLVTRISRPGDVWLHARGVPGAHVLIRPPGGVTIETADPAILYEAAKIAASRSRARQSRKVDVDYTDARYVKKPSGSEPGFVTYSGEKTLTVSLDDGAARERPAGLR